MDTLAEAGLTRLPLDDAGRALLFTAARTANSFAPTPVTDEELAEIWNLAKWPPTALNTQPLRVTYVRTEDGKERLVKHLMEGNRAKTLSAPAVAILSLDTEFYTHAPELFPFLPDLKANFAASAEMRDGTGPLNAGLQAGYFLLAVRAAGLVAGPMSGYDHAGLDAEFFPDGRQKSLVVVNIGHPGENPWFDRLPRLSDDNVLTWA